MRQVKLRGVLVIQMFSRYEIWGQIDRPMDTGVLRMRSEVGRFVIIGHVPHRCITTLYLWIYIYIYIYILVVVVTW